MAAAAPASAAHPAGAACVDSAKVRRWTLDPVGTVARGRAATTRPPAHPPRPGPMAEPAIPGPARCRPALPTPAQDPAAASAAAASAAAQLRRPSRPLAPAEWLPAVGGAGLGGGTRDGRGGGGGGGGGNSGDGRGLRPRPSRQRRRRRSVTGRAFRTPMPGSRSAASSATG